MPSKMEIHQHGPDSATVLVDGKPIQDAVRSYTIHAEKGVPTVVTLSLIAPTLVFSDEAAQVRVSSLTRYVLINLGWTPPPEASVVPDE